MDRNSPRQWALEHIVPLEKEARHWLARHADTLTVADIEDLIQQAYARILTADLSAIERPRAYFYRTLRNLVTEQARRAQIVPMERLGEIEELFIPSEEPGPERRYTIRQELRELARHVQALPNQCRRVFELCKVLGFSIREVADELRLSERTVENHLANAQRHLAEHRVSREGPDREDRSIRTKRHGNKP